MGLTARGALPYDLVMLALNHLAPMHWALAGLLIALVTVTLQFVGNRSLGISSGLEDLCALASDRPSLRATFAEGSAWRLPFLLGLSLGGLGSALLSGGWHPTFAVNPLDTASRMGPAAKVAWFFVGGALTGFGTRLAGGCTSGHGIFGASRLQRASLRSIAAFMTVGLVVSNLLYRVVWR